MPLKKERKKVGKVWYRIKRIFSRTESPLEEIPYKKYLYILQKREHMMHSADLRDKYNKFSLGVEELSES